MADIVLSAINAKWIHPSLALRLLKANLGEYESRCEIIELALRQSLDEKLAILAGIRPRILGLSVSIWNHAASLELLKGLRNIRIKDPETQRASPFIVLGGPEVSYLPEEAEIIRYADFVIRGEGENAFAKLCGRILNNKDPPPRFTGGSAPDVAGIRSAYHLYTDEDLRRKLIYVEASRGCPFACAFCQSAITVAGSANPAAGGQPRRKAVREFPLDDFLSDMDSLLKRLFSVRSDAALPRPTIKFLDRSFNVNVPRALAIMEFFLKKASLAVSSEKFQLHFEMVPSLFPPELTKVISGFPPDMLRLELGIQSFNPKVCAAINRPSQPEKELETLSFLRTQTNAIIHADLIAGLPGEDLASFGEGFDRLWQALTAESTVNAVTETATMKTAAGIRPASGCWPASPPFEIQLGILKGLPGTPLRELDGKFGMRYASGPPYEVVQTAALGKAELDRLRNFARFWELVVNRPWKPGSRPANQETNAAGLPAGNPTLLSPGQPVFWPFMELSEKLLRLFGKNWGIDRKALGAALAGMSPRGTGA
ncbi:MAG: B12-binding domain-containing radical SAM protein [Spirochaetaceae bacterium]|jgi:radical SAM superfamily enzyme YgiQ (UPF0313 family)|nr:B12-binding domain-containing radical SAM protein [Spirochaetaceae bacterium]